MVRGGGGIFLGGTVGVPEQKWRDWIFDHFWISRINDVILISFCRLFAKVRVFPWIVVVVVVVVVAVAVAVVVVVVVVVLVRHVYRIHVTNMKEWKSKSSKPRCLWLVHVYVKGPRLTVTDHYYLQHSNSSIIASTYHIPSGDYSWEGQKSQGILCFFLEMLFTPRPKWLDKNQVRFHHGEIYGLGCPAVSILEPTSGTPFHPPFRSHKFQPWMEGGS